jgi:hypothetical protein
MRGLRGLVEPDPKLLSVVADIRASPDRKALQVEAQVRNLTGSAEAKIWRNNSPGFRDPGFRKPKATASLTLRWTGNLPGEPSVWEETWYWHYGVNPPQDSERLIRNCPDRELLGRALEAMYEALPEDF